MKKPSTHHASTTYTRQDVGDPRTKGHKYSRHTQKTLIHGRPSLSTEGEVEFQARRVGAKKNA